MPEQGLPECSYEYAIVRVVPRVECDEFVNVGIIFFCRVRRFLNARIVFDPTRILKVCPDLDIASIESHLNVIPVICGGGRSAGPIGELEQFERFHWLVAPRSTIIQTSATHSGLCTDPLATLEHLTKSILR
jgi:hypothetical protein